MLRLPTLAALAFSAAACCAAGTSALAAPDPARPMEPIEVTLHDGVRNLDVALAPAIVLELYDAPDAQPRNAAVTPAWRSERDGARVAVAEDPQSGVRVTLRLGALVGGAAELGMEVKYTRRTWIGLAAIDLQLPGPARVPDRDLDLRTVSSVAYLDRFATKKVRAGDLTALVDDGVDGVVVRRAAESKTSLRVELFSTEARPFKHEVSCREDWHDERPLVRYPARLREPGERDAGRVELRGGDGAFLAKARFPEGRPSALVITDHADQSSPDTIVALARGRSDADTAIGGLLKHGLVITKSLFLRGELEDGEGHPQLEDKRVAAIAEEMAQSGSEIGPHSVTPEPDERPVTEEGLSHFDHYHPSTWIDHQPATNCEAFTNQGWHGADAGDAQRWRIADLLAHHGYRYIWAGFDVPQLDLLNANHIDRRPLSLWPVGRLAPGDPDDRWLFATTWMLVDRDEFFRTLSTSRIDQLERDHGLAILHTYLESLHDGDDNPRFANRNVIRRVNGVVELDPRFEGVLADLRRRIDRGTLWMPTLKALGDFLRDVDRVRVRYPADGTALVVSPVAVRGMTFRVPGAVEVRVDGRPPAGRREERGSTVFWFNLPAAHATRVAIRPARTVEPARAARTPSAFFASARPVDDEQGPAATRVR